LTPQQQQLSQRKAHDLVTFPLSPDREEEEEAEPTVDSLTSSIFNLLLQTISPSPPEDRRKRPSTAMSERDTVGGTHGTTLSLGLSHEVEVVQEDEEEAEEDGAGEEAVKRIEECYQEDPQEFSMFGVLDEEDGY
jgi:hypothetical protein